MKNFLVVTLWVATQASYAQTAPLEWKATETKEHPIHYTAADAAIVPELSNTIIQGRTVISSFFKVGYPKSFDVYVFPHRADLDQQWQKDWGAPDFKSECWMVASGVGKRLDLLSTQVWSTEACEHRATEVAETQRLITHELVHVFHGQQNPISDFTGMDDLAWLIEGVAVYASGQLDDKRVASVKKLVSEDKHPKTLGAFWSGKDKYGLAGSLVQFVDQKLGRDKLTALLKETKQEVILAQIGLTEDQLISEWKAALLK